MSTDEVEGTSGTCGCRLSSSVRLPRFLLFQCPQRCLLEIQNRGLRHLTPPACSTFDNDESDGGDTDNSLVVDERGSS